MISLFDSQGRTFSFINIHPKQSFRKIVRFQAVQGSPNGSKGAAGHGFKCNTCFFFKKLPLN